MSIRARIFVDHATGTITDNPLAAGATTINSAEFADLPAVGTMGYIYLTLDPGGANERVEVTAHTASATSVTVNRTASVEHAVGVTWVASVYADDLPQSVDYPAPNFGSKLIFSHEFNGEYSTDPADVSAAWLNQNTATFVRQGGLGVLVHPGATPATFTVRGIEWTPASFPSSWELRAKFHITKLIDGNYILTGLGLRESASNKCMLVGWNYSSGRKLGYRATTNLTTETTPTGATAAITGAMYDPAYLIIRKVGADDYDFLWSPNGVSWYEFASAVAVDTHMTPDRIFMGGDNRAASDIHLACEWIRMWDLT